LPFAAGSRLGPYEEILTALGAGRNEVYKANDMRVDRTVAIKVLPEALAADPRFRERFDRKARAISQLTHSHIARPVMSPPSTAPRSWLWRLARARKMHRKCTRLASEDQMSACISSPQRRRNALMARCLCLEPAIGLEPMTCRLRNPRTKKQKQS
jgi:hypothetical protein